MIRTIELRRSAQCDLDGAIEWYENVGVPVTNRFETAVQSVFDQIALQPDRYPIALGNVREAVLPDRFPYSVFYRSRGQKVIVIAVYHHARDPAGWKDRV